MKTLLQDGLQAHPPAPPEKRLLINQIHTDPLMAEQVADEIVRLYRETPPILS